LDVFEAIKTRRSIRRFKPIDISDQLIRSIIDCARCAPSADNIQPWEFIIVKDRHTKELLSKTHAWSYFIKDAPVCIVILSNESLSPSYFAIDAACATQNLLLASHSQDLGACWVAVYDPNNPNSEMHVRNVLNVPAHFRIIAMVPVGYPYERIEPRKLRDLDDVLHVDKY